MERLMIEYDGQYVPKKLCTIDRLGGADDCDGCVDNCNGECESCAIQECFTKLAEYENTALDPSEIKQLVIDICKGDYKKWQEKLSQMVHDKYEEALKGSASE